MTVDLCRDLQPVNVGAVSLSPLLRVVDVGTVRVGVGAIRLEARTHGVDLLLHAIRPRVPVTHATHSARSRFRCHPRTGPGRPITSVVCHDATLICLEAEGMWPTGTQLEFTITAGRVGPGVGRIGLGSISTRAAFHLRNPDRRETRTPARLAAPTTCSIAREPTEKNYSHDLLPI